MSPAVEALGLRAIGAYRVAMANDSEAIVIWAIPDWPTWADYEQAWDGARRCRRGGPASSRSAPTCKRTLLVDAPLSPMRIGRQPEVGDRRPLSEL